MLCPSSQLYKQLSMVAGFDRYMQIARCFRDEDLPTASPNLPRLTEMFCHVEDVLEIEDFLNFSARYGLRPPLPRLSYTEAMERYVGQATPRMELSRAVKDCGLVFADAISGGNGSRHHR